MNLNKISAFFSISGFSTEWKDVIFSKSTGGMLDQNRGFNLTHFNSVASLLATVHGVHRLGAWEKDDLQRHSPSSHSACISVDDCVA